MKAKCQRRVIGIKAVVEGMLLGDSVLRGIWCTFKVLEVATTGKRSEATQRVSYDTVRKEEDLDCALRRTDAAPISGPYALSKYSICIQRRWGNETESADVSHETCFCRGLPAVVHKFVGGQLSLSSYPSISFPRQVMMSCLPDGQLLISTIVALSSPR